MEAETFVRNSIKAKARPSDTSDYVLGYSESEFRRLEKQANFYRDFTEDMLRRAGLERGMRVLDLGCGVGDVSLLAGEIVGPSGSVLGIDRSREALDVAERRATAAGQCYWVRFATADLAAYEPKEKFDAVIGRFVLMYMPDPAGMLRRLSGWLAPGGIVAFQEMCMPMARSIPETPVLRQTIQRIAETFVRAGFEKDMGGKLFRSYLDAGLPVPQMISHARTEGGPDSFAYSYVAMTVNSLLPAMQKTGVIDSATPWADGLADRLRDEAVMHDSCIMLPPLVGAWTRLPA